MGKMDASMQVVALCQEFHWTYDEYMQQPAWFIALIKEKLVRDNKERELEYKKSRRG